MKYMVLIQSNAQFMERWAALSDEQRARFGHAHLALSADLAASGELVASEGLADPALAKRVTARDDGQVLVSDGPFAEVKEHLAGFMLVDVADEARALEIAAQVPDAVWGLVEVRPVLDMSQWDL
ncbi:MAG: YciI family protein [Actinobacteria bacterium]|nr:YciI family protein [Actinomycetota bacterium]